MAGSGTKEQFSNKMLHHSSQQCQLPHSMEIIDYLKNKNIELLSHWPYSSDLSPNNFFFSPYVKQKNAWSAIFINWGSCWCVPKLFFWGVNFRMEKLFQELIMKLKKFAPPCKRFALSGVLVWNGCGNQILACDCSMLKLYLQHLH